ncbi:Carboxypeptidase-related protein [Indibacter alkaliphilus LW1]|uniref:Carboxypeptidase-related protein n=1 Tax=Indibacter alkaliphilus (strain CCUG 57479 / KCTC 22604 / LW1) TaxID=1189612 RepID=S2E421_INDAL|nr:carboxypeptidase [Indibacter alkaliphilus]EOZ96963.1 Carboxypeptidase-related protein [Indibacter alkaliphilus LW1]
MKKINLFIFLFILGFSLANAQEKESNKDIPEAQVFTSTQTVRVNGTTHSLKTRAGTMLLRDENNEPIALHGFTAYFKEDGPSKRPIIFSYNGGPGSSSYWLHMGVMGPKRIVVNDPGYTPAAPYELVNNDHSILDMADVVMMDPIGTGLSKPVGKAEGKDFWGVDQDIRAISLFIMQFLKEYDRLQSPKYLLGESYGTMRNAGVMKYLLDKGYALNGVVMVSSVFDIRSLAFPVQESTSYLVHFPSYAATAWYHDKIANKNPDLEVFVDEVRTFTEEEYLPALFKGGRLSDSEKGAIASKMQQYTGISSEIWKRNNLRMRANEFFNELLREEGMTVGRLDSRFKGINPMPQNQYSITDPQSDAISPAYTAGFLDYFHRDLGVSKDLTYKTSAYASPGFKWDWSHKGNEGWGSMISINTAIDMADAMNKDPNLKVLMMNGYYDLATVFYGVEHTVDQMNLRPEIRDNIIMTYYEAGHMFYTHMPSLIKFKKDLADFIKDTTHD